MSEQVIPDELLDVVVLELLVLVLVELVLVLVLLELVVDALVEPPEPAAHPTQGP